MAAFLCFNPHKSLICNCDIFSVFWESCYNSCNNFSSDEAWCYNLCNISL